MAFTTALKTTVSALALSAFATTAMAEDVEVLHWWTSGSEAEALGVLKDDLGSKGVGWNDMPVAGGSGVEAMTVLRARVVGGDAPTAAQMLGFDIKDWAESTGQLANLDAVAAEEGWDDVVPAPLQDFSKFDGHWIAAPVNVHSTNWVWINKKALDQAGGKVPESWDELVVVLDKMKENGITPIAHGGQPWQDGTVFEAVVLGMGTDFYNSAIIELDPEALGGPQMVEVFDRMSKLRSYVDDNFSGRDWNLASTMVINGDAGMQFMGDWAKGEFLKAEQVPGEDFVCARFPGTQGEVLFNSDQFVMFDQGDASDAQMLMASAVMDPKFQSAFNIVKGSVPARTDVSGDGFDACGQKGIGDFAEANEAGSLFGSLAHGHAQPTAIKNAFFDVITAQFNGDYDSQTAAEELVNAVEAAK
ncbi:ABC transporter substrate-binding protein [Pseudoruegeria sp. SK021]|uniref:ABC transporter substrate-binding protein n=1 Tax=Pseudoruegeria sp. SK021 TaxID=1933035 RepID=UPI000A2664FE|nr:ABC transporter substrate-binding protein [Pseudoruegeria sp. SK021]OSP53617.1 sugar ABC transporter substrate-binding protein [Pseudoruegeria sp. SK021]